MLGFEFLRQILINAQYIIAFDLKMLTIQNYTYIGVGWYGLTKWT